MKTLYSGLGLSPGVLFSALVHERPQRLVVVTSAQARSGLESALAAAARFGVEPAPETAVYLLADPMTGFAEGRALASKLAGKAGPENVVNVVGGTTAIQDCLAAMARLVLCRQIAVIDRRDYAAQRADPFVLGELVVLPGEGGPHPGSGPVESDYLCPLWDSIENAVAASGADCSVLFAAYRLAEKRHAGQFRDTGSLHLGHLLRVAACCCFEFAERDPEVLAAALLHDALEDCLPFDRWAEGEAELAQATTPRVAAMVRLLSKPEEASREEEVQIDKAYLSGLEAAAGSLAPVRTVKLADKLDNVRSMRRNPRPAKRGKYLSKTRAIWLPFADRHSSPAAAALRLALERLAATVEQS